MKKEAIPAEVEVALEFLDEEFEKIIEDLKKESK